jgi:putative drug exporter of the RND superfamily
LLLATALVVAVLLLLTYRSPVLWIIPLLVVGLADGVTTQVVVLLAQHTSIRVDDAASGITSVIVFGAGTDYALLLISRYRDNLRHQQDRFAAMADALGSTGTSIVSSGATVTVSLLTLLLCHTRSLQAIGFSAAIGIVVAMIFALFVLPSALVVCGRGVFWPLVPKVGDETVHDGRIFGRIGAATRRSPILVVVLSTVFLVALSLGSIGAHVGLSQTEQFTARPESVVGQELLARSFPAGSSEPVIIITNAEQATGVASAAEAVPGVVAVTTGPTNGTLTQLSATVSAAPSTPASKATVEALRSAVAGVPGADAVVGGTVATEIDQRNAASRDAGVVIPLVLLIVFVVLLVLLRSLVAAVLLVATVLGTYFAALGASWLLFSHVLHYPALANQTRILAFLFLVALGVDYNIFLTDRARQETAKRGPGAGMLEALRATGGVITSAGVLLAAVFAVLGVLPLVTLKQIGIIVGIGVLLDTLLVRTVLVPALAFLLDRTFWWPGPLSRPQENPMVESAVVAPAS